ncbi:MAG: sulfatase [Bacteroidales bacterium]|nr:sulfatase [Bacteroidales bacterium]
MKLLIPGIAGLCLLGSCTEKIPSKPNVLFIAVDDLRPELNCYGENHIYSPNIDRLANDGIIFSNAYCNIPVSGASRASLLTGLRPTRNRFLTYHTRVDEEADNVPTLPENFRMNGYYTVSNSKVFHHSDDGARSWDEVWLPQGKGSWRDYITKENLLLDSIDIKLTPPFERVDVPDNAYKDGKTADKTIADLKRLSKTGQPFFLAAGFLKPHLPFNAPDKYWKMYDPDKIMLPENDSKPENAPDESMHNFGELRNYGMIPKEGPVSAEMAKMLIHGYYSCVSYTDAQIGKVLNALDELGLTENTIIILWGDHGWNLLEHGLWCKHSNYETSLHAPLIIRAPGIDGGKTNHSISEFIDIYPTLCELSGIEIPVHVEGESLIERLQNPEKTENDYAVSKYYNGTTLIEGDYFFTEWSSAEKPFISRMLYNHKSDPGENLNISEMDEYLELSQKMTEDLHEKWGADFERD